MSPRLSERRNSINSPIISVCRPCSVENVDGAKIAVGRGTGTATGGEGGCEGGGVHGVLCGCPKCREREVGGAVRRNSTAKEGLHVGELVEQSMATKKALEWRHERAHWRERTGAGSGGQGGLECCMAWHAGPPKANWGRATGGCYAATGRCCVDSSGRGGQTRSGTGGDTSAGRRGPREDFWWEVGSAVYGVARRPCGTQARPKSNKRVTLLRRHRVCGGRHACRARRTATGMDETGVRGRRELNREMGVEHANTRGVQ